VNISVLTDFAVMSETPQADILLLRRQSTAWTAPQLARLPDGIRHCQAGQILIEFKYTESFNEKALLQALGYDTFYKRAKELHNSEVQTFLVLAKTPQSATLAEFGYDESHSYPGVFYTPSRGFRNVILMSLNDLSQEPHNAFFKCFASRRQEKQKAFDLLKQSGLQSLTLRLKLFLAGLWEYWFQLIGEDMNIELTPEQLMEMGKMWGDWYLSELSVEQRLAGLAPAERLRGLKPEERLRGLKPQEVLSQFKPEERLSGLKPEERLSGLKPQERLSGLKPQERLSGLKPQEVLSQFKPAERLSGLKPQERLSGLKPQEVLSLFKPAERLSGLKPQEVLSQFKPEELEHYLNQLKHQKNGKTGRPGRS
jgi:hypothetical protein